MFRQTALIVIDVQNDYFPAGRFPLWDADAVLDRTSQAVRAAQNAGMPVILVRHEGTASSPFFVPGSEGAAIHPALLSVCPDAPVVVKMSADAFRNTTLQTLLNGLGVKTLLLCGMMTQNCVTHTALSPQAADYEIRVAGDLCTTVSQILHLIALRALADRLPVQDWDRLCSSIPCPA